MDCWEVAFIWASYSLCDTLLQNDLVSFNPLVVSCYWQQFTCGIKGNMGVKKTASCGVSFTVPPVVHSLE